MYEENHLSLPLKYSAKFNLVVSEVSMQFNIVGLLSESLKVIVVIL